MLNLEINPIFGLDNILTFKKGGGIHIKKKNRGKFTKSAKAAGESVQEHAAHVLSDPNATPLLKKRANFARNAAKWKHQLGGTLKLTPEEEQYLAWSKLSPELKRQRNTNIAKSFINRGPSISNYWNAAKAYFGGFNPTNPNLNTGNAPAVMMQAGSAASLANAVSSARRAYSATGPNNAFSLTKLWRMINKKVGRNLDSEELVDLIHNALGDDVMIEGAMGNNGFPVIRITEEQANNLVNSLRPGLKRGGVLKMQFSGKFKTRDINGNWVYMDMNTGRTTSAGPESGTIRNNAVNSVGGDNKTKQGRTKIALKQATSYNNRQYKVHNYADTTMRLKLKNQDVVLDKQGEPEIIQADYTPTLEAPMEIVSPEFDLLTLGRQAATSIYNAAKPAAKPTIKGFAEATPAVEESTNTLSKEQINKAFEEARQWHLSRINSPGYKNRALKAGFTEDEIPQLQQQLTDQINSLKLRNSEEVFPNITKQLNSNGPARAEYWLAINNKGGLSELGIGFYGGNDSTYDDAVSTFVHEFGHGATYGLNGTETAGLIEQYPLIARAVKYNKSLYPEVTEDAVGKVIPSAVKTGNTKYFAEPTEMLSRGYEFMRDAENNVRRLRNTGATTMKFNDLVGKRNSSIIFSRLAGLNGSLNFLKSALGIAAPIGMTAGYGMSLGDEEQAEFLKKGGKVHKPFGHRSILDNGWQSTKLLKNKKNVYGK